MLSFIINASNNYKENSLAFGSDKKDKIKTNRISSLPIMNKEKKKALVNHFSKLKRHKNNNIYNRFCVDVLRNTFHTLKDGQYVPLKMKRENVRIGLSKLFEADNECQRHLKSFQKL